MKVHVYLYGLTEVEPDLEHWTESACLARAAIDTFGEDQVELHQKDQPGMSILRADDILLGAVPGQHRRSTFAWPDWDSHRAADQYPHNPAFEELAGRRLMLADAPGQGAREGHRMSECIAYLRESGASRLLLKWLPEAKKIPNLVLEPDDEVVPALREWLGWEAIHFEGHQDAVLVQEFLPMTRELRYFVVDGQIVTGSGKVPEATPLMRLATTVRGRWVAPFKREEPWEYTQSEHSLAVEPPPTREFADEAVRALMRSDARLRDFVIDIAATPQGYAVVELNPVTRSGLFASNPYQLVDAIRTAVQTREAAHA